MCPSFRISWHLVMCCRSEREREREREDPNADTTSKPIFNSELQVTHDDKHEPNGTTPHWGWDEQGSHPQAGGCDWTTENETQVDTMRAGPATIQKEPISHLVRWTDVLRRVRGTLRSGGPKRIAPPLVEVSSPSGSDMMQRSRQRAFCDVVRPDYT